MPRGPQNAITLQCSTFKGVNTDTITFMVFTSPCTLWEYNNLLVKNPLTMAVSLYHFRSVDEVPVQVNRLLVDPGGLTTL